MTFSNGSKCFIANSVVEMQDNLCTATRKPSPLFRKTQFPAELHANYNFTLRRVQFKQVIYPP